MQKRRKKLDNTKGKICCLLSEKHQIICLTKKRPKSIAKRGSQTCTIKTNGNLYCRGKNEYGQIGTSRSENRQNHSNQVIKSSCSTTLIPREETEFPELKQLLWLMVFLKQEQKEQNQRYKIFKRIGLSSYYTCLNPKSFESKNHWNQNKGENSNNIKTSSCFKLRNSKTFSGSKLNL